jgi:hypothetical protein
MQGAEKDVILLSTTVTGAPGEGNSGGSAAGFTGDARRLNVALTRARRHLLLFGQRRALGAASPALADVMRVCSGPPPPLMHGQQQRQQQPVQDQQQLAALEFSSPHQLLQHLRLKRRDHCQ